MGLYIIFIFLYKYIDLLPNIVDFSLFVGVVHSLPSFHCLTSGQVDNSIAHNSWKSDAQNFGIFFFIRFLAQ